MDEFQAVPGAESFGQRAGTEDDRAFRGAVGEEGIGRRPFWAVSRIPRETRVGAAPRGIVDALFVEVPKQRNGSDENKEMRAGNNAGDLGNENLAT